MTRAPQLAYYLSQVTHQTPIESQFVKMLVDNLNAEITLGTVTNVPEVCGRRPLAPPSALLPGPFLSHAPARAAPR